MRMSEDVAVRVAPRPKPPRPADGKCRLDWVTFGIGSRAVITSGDTYPTIAVTKVIEPQSEYEGSEPDGRTHRFKKKDVLWMPDALVPSELEFERNVRRGQYVFDATVIALGLDLEGVPDADRRELIALIGKILFANDRCESGGIIDSRRAWRVRAWVDGIIKDKDTSPDLVRILKNIVLH